eukprot:s257_g6.t1
MSVGEPSFESQKRFDGLPLMKLLRVWRNLQGVPAAKNMTAEEISLDSGLLTLWAGPSENMSAVSGEAGAAGTPDLQAQGFLASLHFFYLWKMSPRKTINLSLNKTDTHRKLNDQYTSKPVACKKVLMSGSASAGRDCTDHRDSARSSLVACVQSFCAMGQSPGKLPGSVQLQRGEAKPKGCTEAPKGGSVNFALDAPGRGSAWLYLQLPTDHEGASALGVSSQGGEAYVKTWTQPTWFEGSETVTRLPAATCSIMRGRMAMGRTFGGEGFHCLRDELMPPPTPISHRDVASEGPRCYIGVCTFQNQGKNGENQDSYIATENGTKSLVAVLDGHGEQGKRVSEFARSQLAKNLYASKELYTKPTMAMENAYAETQRGIERSHTIDAQRSGTTAVACYRHRDRLVVANVGDSRAVLGRCSSREANDLKWNEGRDRAPALDFGPQTRLLRVTREQLLASKNTAVLFVSPSGLKTFSMKIDALWDRVRFHENEAIGMKELLSQKSKELQEATEETQALKKLLLEEAERMQMRMADQESLILSALECRTVMTIPSAKDQKEETNAEALEKALQDLAAAEQQRKQSVRSNRTMQKLLDAVHHELNEESERSEASRHEARRARSEANVLRALVQRAGSPEASEISQTIPSQEWVDMDLVKQDRTIHMAAMQKTQQHLDEERQNADALAAMLEEVLEKSSQLQRRLDEKELEHRQLRVEMEKVKGELAQHHQRQPILLQERIVLERRLQEFTQAEIARREEQKEEKEDLEQQLQEARASANELKVQLQQALSSKSTKPSNSSCKRPELLPMS